VVADDAGVHDTARDDRRGEGGVLANALHQAGPAPPAGGRVQRVEPAEAADEHGGPADRGVGL
jgi:hypothetical protein